MLKPSEQVPLTQELVFNLIDDLGGLPAGVINLVNGGADVVNGLLDHPGVDAVSFVGSAKVARYVYERAAANGKRVQALGGAKNFMVVMPDAVMGKTVSNIIGSAFGAAGQRCMAGSVVVAVGDAKKPLLDELTARTRELSLGDGLERGTDVGPVVSTHRPRPHPGVDRSWHRGRRDGGRRRPHTGGKRRRLLRRPDHPRRRDARHGHRPGGGVRAGALGDPRRARSTRRSRS